MKHQLFKNGMFIFMGLISMFFGGIMIYLGFEQFAEVKNRPDPYDTVSGFLYDYEVIEETADGTIYQLEYAYYVGGEEYKLFTQSIQDSEPEWNKRVDIIYDLYNPEVAQIAYKETYPMLILAGALLAIVPLVLWLGSLIASGVFSLHHTNLLEITVGLAFVGFGLLFSYAFCGTFSPIKAFQICGATAAFPILFLIAGALLIAKGLLGDREKKQ